MENFVQILICVLFVSGVTWMLIAGIRKKYDPALPTESHDGQDSLEGGVRDAMRMLAFAARRGIAIDAADVESILIAKREGQSISSEQEARFWTATGTVAKAILPVTAETLAATQFVARDGQSESDLAVKKYRNRNIFTLFFLLLFQIYWLVGATIMSDLKDIRGRLEGIYADQMKSRVRLALINEKQPDYVVQKQQFDLDSEGASNRIWAERVAARANFAILQKWNLASFTLRKSFQSSVEVERNPSSTDTVKQDSVDEVNEKSYFLWILTPGNVEQMQSAQILLTALLKYVLPLLYGALGASAFIMRNVADEIRASTYQSSSRIRYQLRFYLGAVAGFSIAWFTADPKSADNAGILQSLSPLALAFLAGYSVDLLFSVLDRFVSAFSGPVAERR